MVIIITIQTFFLLSIVSISLFIGIIVALKNPRSIVHQSFLIFLIGVVMVALGFLLLSWHAPFNLFDKTIHYGGLILLLGIFIFSHVFPDKTAFPRRRLYLLVPFVLIAFFVIPFNLLIRKSPYDASGAIHPVNGPLLLPYAIFWGAYFLISIILLVRRSKNARGRTKLQMQYLFTGIIISFVCLFIFDLLLPMLGDSRFFIVGPLSSLVGVGFAAYAIIRHELFDIRIVIQRGLIYFLLFSFTCGIYIASFEGLAILVHSIADTASIISAGITMVIGVFFIRPLGDYFKKATDHVFFKDSYDYADALHMLSKVLHTNVTETDIIAHSSELLKKIFKSEDATFYLGEDCSLKIPTSPLEISVLIAFEEKCIGILILGPKRSGDKYTQTDRRLLETFAYQAAVALEKGQLYEKVERYNTDLERLVEERTKELKKFQEDQKQAMIDISHNLQTPLAVIRGELELLPILDDAVLVKTVKKSIDRVSDFIRQLLHLARLEHSVYTVELSSLDLSNLVQGQVEYFEVMAQEKEAVIIVSLESGITIVGNKRLLEELLTNLFSNALLYHSPYRKSRIIITLAATPKHAIFSIEDNGVGIAPEDLPQLFMRFYQGKHRIRLQETTEDTQAGLPAVAAHAGQAGTGLGLAICKKIVEKHNGSISVDSIFGEKTVFTIKLPLI
jgi:signal transduction histidine kinase